jgi:hypothetical protein
LYSFDFGAAIAAGRLKYGRQLKDAESVGGQTFLRGILSLAREKSSFSYRFGIAPDGGFTLNL